MTRRVETEHYRRVAFLLHVETDPASSIDAHAPASPPHHTARVRREHLLQVRLKGMATEVVKQPPQIEPATVEDVLLVHKSVLINRPSSSLMQMTEDNQERPGSAKPQHPLIAPRVPNERVGK